MNRRFDDVDILVVYMDGIVIDRHHILAAVGVDCQGLKQILGVAPGSSENADLAFFERLQWSKKLRGRKWPNRDLGRILRDHSALHKKMNRSRNAVAVLSLPYFQPPEVCRDLLSQQLRHLRTQKNKFVSGGWLLAIALREALLTGGPGGIEVL